MKKKGGGKFAATKGGEIDVMGPHKVNRNKLLNDSFFSEFYRQHWRTKTTRSKLAYTHADLNNNSCGLEIQADYFQFILRTAHTSCDYVIHIFRRSFSR